MGHEWGNMLGGERWRKVSGEVISMGSGEWRTCVGRSEGSIWKR